MLTNVVRRGDLRPCHLTRNLSLLLFCISLYTYLQVSAPCRITEVNNYIIQNDSCILKRILVGSGGTSRLLVSAAEIALFQNNEHCDFKIFKFCTMLSKIY